MKLLPNEVHIWIISLKHIESENLKAKRQLLSFDEIKRANRFHFKQHCAKFITTHHAVRIILSQYLFKPAAEIQFTANDYGKPYIAASELKFNLSHSHDYAVLACANNMEIGIDIEFIQSAYEIDVAKRFFSEQENNQLQSLKLQSQVPVFFKIWARKEALIKAVGTGLHIPLDSFSVDSDAPYEQVKLDKEQYYLLPLSLETDYAAALASNHSIKKVFMWRYFEQIAPRSY